MNENAGWRDSLYFFIGNSKLFRGLMHTAVLFGQTRMVTRKQYIELRRQRCGGSELIFWVHLVLN